MANYRTSEEGSGTGIESGEEEGPPSC